MQLVIAIPARMASTRFPGKPLCDLLGKPMIQWVVEAAIKAELTPRVVVATPDEEIVEACQSFGAEAVLTSSDHVSGTDRLAELAESIVADIYINVQGDEPLIKPETIRACAQPLIGNAEVHMASIWTDATLDEEANPAVVKVVCDQEQNALYFCRYPIPFARNPRLVGVRKHVGIYGYRREVLARFATWAPTPLEQTESLEQLRFLENGVKIRMAQGEGAELAVDTPEQAEEVRKILRERV